LQVEDHGTGSRVNLYITSVVLDLFDEFKTAIANRIEGYDFHCNWYHLVAFILFVMEIRHKETDDEGRKLLSKGIDFYIEDKKNQESYINYFGVIEFQSGLTNYKPKTLSKNTHALIGAYSKAWNNNLKSDPDIIVSEVFGQNLATDDDNRHVTLAFKFLYNQFSIDGSNATIKLFNCRKK